MRIGNRQASTARSLATQCKSCGVFTGNASTMSRSSKVCGIYAPPQARPSGSPRGTAANTARASSSSAVLPVVLPAGTPSVGLEPGCSPHRSIRAAARAGSRQALTMRFLAMSVREEKGMREQTRCGSCSWQQVPVPFQRRLPYSRNLARCNLAVPLSLPSVGR